MNRKIPVLRRAEAQAEAGPLMLMVRRANMGLSIAARRGNRKARTAFSWFQLDAAGPDFPSRSRPRATSRVTTLPAPITAPSPIVTPGRMMAPPPIQTSLPIRTGRPNSRPVAACLGVARMVGGVDLHRRSDLGAVADR